MDDERRARQKRNDEAAKTAVVALKKMIDDEPHVRELLIEQACACGRSVQPPLAVLKRGARVRISGFADLERLVHSPLWEDRIREAAATYVNCGLALASLVSDGPSSAEGDAGLLAVAKFLHIAEALPSPPADLDRCDDQDANSVRKMVSALREIEHNSPAIHAYARDRLRHLGKQIPRAPELGAFRRAVRSAVREVEWEEDAQSIRDSLGLALAHVRSATTTAVTLRNASGAYTWVAVAVFLRISSTNNLEEIQLTNFADLWCPKPVRPAPAPKRPDTGKDPLDVSPKMFPQRRSRMAVGQMHKNGSRHDNRGHR